MGGFLFLNGFLFLTFRFYYFFQINNAGVSYDHAEFFDQISDDLVARLIQLNVTSLTRLTKLVIPGMVARKRGLIMNVGSAAGTLPCGEPLYAVYAATKAYVNQFSRSLNLELKGKGVHVENSIPYFVVSKLSKVRAGLMTPVPTAYARSALARAGRQATIVPFFWHAVQDAVVHCVPEWLFGIFILKDHLSIRARALKKKQNAAKAQ